MLKMNKKNFSDLCEYEKQRLQNIKEREELFKEVLEAKNRVNSAFKKKPTKYKWKPKAPPAPRKKSRRIAAAVKGDVVVKYKDDYELRTLLPEEIFYKFQPCDSFVEKLNLAKGLYTSFVQKICVPEKEGKLTCKNQFIERLNGYKKKRCGYNANRIVETTCCSIHPTNHMILGCVGSSDGMIRLENLDVGHKGKYKDVNYFIPHTGKIFNQTWDICNPEKMITSSADGTVRIFDIRTLQSSLLFGDEKFVNGNGSCFNHQQIDRDTFLISKGLSNNGLIGVIDTRKGVLPVQEFEVSKTVGDMKSIDVHPLKKSQYLTADGEGQIKLFDTRNMKKRARGKMSKVIPLATFENDEPDSSAHWSPITGNKVIVSNSTEMKLYSYDTVDTCKDRIPVHFRLQNQKSQAMGLWHPKYDDIYMKACPDIRKSYYYSSSWLSTWIVGTNDNIDIHNSFKWVHEISYPGISKLLENMAIHPTLDVIIGFNQKGNMTLFEYDDIVNTVKQKDSVTAEDAADVSNMEIADEITDKGDYTINPGEDFDNVKETEDDYYTVTDEIDIHTFTDDVGPDTG